MFIHIKDIKYINTTVKSNTTLQEQIKDRGNYLEEIKTYAERSQKNIINIIEKNKASGKVDYYYSYYIINAINIVAKGEVIKEIASLSNVISIEKNGESELSTDENLFTESELSANISWNHSNTYIDYVHSKGIKGKDIIIGFLDSGVDYTHIELKDNWRGNSDEAKYCWFDAFDESTVPIDGEESGHGTAVAGIAIGKTYGVAPKADWIAARAFKGKRTNNSDILKAAEWLLAPGGDPGKAPDIINNSCGETSKTIWFDNMIKSWLNAGIVPVFASGNSKSESPFGTIEYPASNLDIISVGATDENNNIGYFSKRGPSNLDSTGKIIKPEIVAPGVSIFTSQLGNKYDYWTGTSMATPNISGVVALILENNKNLTNPYNLLNSDIKKILAITATPITDSKNTASPNMTYGYGLVNARDALELSTVYEKFSNINRIFGSDRNKTAIGIARKFYTGNSNTVYITNGNKYADGLSMGSLTKYNNGPLLLTSKDNISPELKVMLNQLSPSKIIIIGGENTVSLEVEKYLKDYAFSVERISGSNRINTSIEIAKKVDDINNLTEIFLVNAFEEADSINIVSVSSRDGIPVLFTSKDILSKETKEYLIDENIKKINIIGGNNTISQNIENELKDLNISTSRIAGGDRFLTAIEINKKYHSNTSKLFFANAYNIADALSVGPVAGKLGAQIQILPTDIFPSTVKDYYQSKTITDFYILGGTNSISNRNAYNIFKLFK